MPSLLGLRDTNAELLRYFVDQAKSMAEVLQRPVAKVPVLRGKRIALTFFESSTRTKMSFELAAKSLGADVLSFSEGSSSLSKGETVLDTVMTIAALGADCVVIRDRHSLMPVYLTKHLKIPVINAGDGTNEHPTQALLDLAVLDESWQGQFQGKTLAIVGDVARSRVARSHLWAARHLGMAVRIVAPKVFVEPGFEECFNVSVYNELKQGISGANAVMALRVQKERRSTGGPYIASNLDYFEAYGLTRQKLNDWAPGALLLHPGPVNRAVELAPDLLYDEPRSQIQRQVTMGVALRMAVLYWSMGGGNHGEG